MKERSTVGVVRYAVLVLATLRLVRFLTTDKLGEWTIVGPLKRWAWRNDQSLSEDIRTRLEEVFVRDMREGKPQETPPAHRGWRSKMVNGLDCGYCLSPWITGGLLIGEATLGRIPVVKHVWRWLTATLALSYVIGHAWKRLDVG